MTYLPVKILPLLAWHAIAQSNPSEFRFPDLQLPPAIRTFAYNHILQASGGALPYQFRLSAGSLPPGLSLSATGTLRGTPTTTGFYVFQVEARDAASTVRTAQISLRVEGDRILTLKNPDFPPCKRNFYYEEPIYVNGATGQVTYRLIDSSPVDEMEIRDGFLRGMPRKEGWHKLLVRFNDSSGGAGEGEIRFFVAGYPVLKSKDKFLPMTIGRAVRIPVEIEGGLPPYRFQPGFDRLPPGIRLTSDGYLEGIPMQGGIGDIFITIRDAFGQEDFGTIKIGIGNPRPMTQGVVGSPYSFADATSPGQPIWELDPGGLTLVPEGLSMSPDGSLTGQIHHAGRVSFNVRRIDSAGNPVFEARYLDSLASTARFHIIDFAIPVLRLGRPYRFTLQASEAGSTWRLRQGKLPPGIVFTSQGEFTGQASTIAFEQVLIEARTPDGRTATSYFHVRVEEPRGPYLSVFASAADYRSGTIAPGELLVLFGEDLGPEKLGVSDFFQGELMGVPGQARVILGLRDTPTLYAAKNQLAVFAPYQLTPGEVVEFWIERNGPFLSAHYAARVVIAKPALFTLSANGIGPAAATNQTGTINSESQRARKGSIVSFYGTGFGVTFPAGPVGRIATSVSRVMSEVKATLDGNPVVVHYAGNSPGLLEGIVQLNVQVPDDAQSGLRLFEVEVAGARSKKVGIWIE